MSIITSFILAILLPIYCALINDKFSLLSRYNRQTILSCRKKNLKNIAPEATDIFPFEKLGNRVAIANRVQSVKALSPFSTLVLPSLAKK